MPSHTDLFHQPTHPDTPKHLMVIGASGGIGQALCTRWRTQYPQARITRLARSLNKLTPLSGETHDHAIDLTKPESIAEALSSQPAPDWVMIATGWLHDAQHSPEKSLRQLDAEHLLKSYALNAVGPTLCLQQLVQNAPLKHRMAVAVLSARVGSISDNRLGGWHAYRASKAALNMLIKNTALELLRQKRPISVIGLQPGTVATDLSAPFQRNVPAHKLLGAEEVAEHISALYPQLNAAVSGQLFDYLGNGFEP